MRLKPHKILVIDNNNERRRKMLDPFRDLPDIEVRSFDLQAGKVLTDLHEKGNWKPDPIEHHHFVLLLIHARDNNWKDAQKFTKRIWYGGNQGFDSDVPSGEDKIERAIVSSGFLKIEEAIALMEYAMGIGNKPDCLIKIDEARFIRQELSVQLIMQLNQPQKAVIETIQLPGALSDCNEVFASFKTKAIKLIQDNADLSPFDPKYLRLLKELKEID